MNALVNFEIPILGEPLTTAWESANKLAWDEHMRGLEMYEESLLALVIFIAMGALGYLNMVLFDLFLESFILCLQIGTRLSA